MALATLSTEDKARAIRIAVNKIQWLVVQDYSHYITLTYECNIPNELAKSWVESEYGSPKPFPSANNLSHPPPTGYLNFALKKIFLDIISFLFFD